jgi:hypothetical protein
MRAYNETGQSIKHEEIRYINHGNKNPEYKYREQKVLFANVYCIHVEEGSFLLRDSNSNIDIIIISSSSLSYDRSKASSKASSPHSAIQSFLFQLRVSSPFFKVIQ